jgi:hypothetical protein
MRMAWGAALAVLVAAGGCRDERREEATGNPAGVRAPMATPHGDTMGAPGTTTGTATGTAVGPMDTAGAAVGAPAAAVPPRP